MEPLYEYAWLIPVFPLAGAMLVGLGLISLNKFTNGLRDLNAVLIISLMGAAMVMSFAILNSQFQGQSRLRKSNGIERLPVLNPWRLLIRILRV